MEYEVEKLFEERILQEAGDRFGLKRGIYKKLGDFENYVFEGVREKEGEPAILRLTHSSHRSEEQVQAELNWIRYLTEEGGLSIPGCILSREGRLTERIEARDGGTYFTAGLFRKAEGHLPEFDNPEEWNAELFRSWGSITGQMHKLTTRYEPAPGAARRPAWEEDDLLENAAEYTAPGEEFVLERLEAVLTRLRSLPKGTDAYGLIHTDIHPRNFFVDGRGGLQVFDFDDSAYNWFIHDIAIPLYYSLSWGVPESYMGDLEAFASDFLSAFWQGYREAYELPAEWLSELPTFLAFRDLNLYLVIRKKVAPGEMNERMTRWLGQIVERIRRGESIVRLASWSPDHG
ncbi:phosphotransferase enzyme family protein [Paenibacillus silviterrae]|uniref:phosphotransferase enzyme family protein n=1 Tax=Paenibacillus silviterrae TaxID=3242194 RepID=UPI002543F74D|nr:phosphotransferase [Paenibacillus chinjuensis]